MIDKIIKKDYAVTADTLSNDLTLSYINNFGETITFKLNSKGIPYFNHTDIHEEGEFVPTEVSTFYVLDNDEKAILKSFEIMALYNQQQNRVLELLKK